MGIYTDDLTILGLRILIEKPYNNHDYYTEYEFTGDNWKINAAQVLPYYLGRADIRFQTLHPFSTSHNIHTGQQITPGNIWLNNNLLKITDLLQ